MLKTSHHLVETHFFKYESNNLFDGVFYTLSSFSSQTKNITSKHKSISFSSNPTLNELTWLTSACSNSEKFNPSFMFWAPTWAYRLIKPLFPHLLHEPETPQNTVPYANLYSLAPFSLSLFFIFPIILTSSHTFRFLFHLFPYIWDYIYAKQFHSFLQNSHLLPQ